MGSAVIIAAQKMHLNMSSGKYRPFCLGVNVFTIQVQVPFIYLSSLSQPPGAPFTNIFEL